MLKLIKPNSLLKSLKLKLGNYFIQSSAGLVKLKGKLGKFSHLTHLDLEIENFKQFSEEKAQKVFQELLYFNKLKYLRLIIGDYNTINPIGF